MGDKNVEEYIRKNARKKVGISVYQIDETRITSIIKDVISNQIGSIDEK
jgi:hypothetical protein